MPWRKRFSVLWRGKNYHTIVTILRKNWKKQFGSILSSTTSNGRIGNWICRALTNSNRTIGIHRYRFNQERDIKKDFWGVVSLDASQKPLLLQKKRASRIEKKGGRMYINLSSKLYAYVWYRKGKSLRRIAETKTCSRPVPGASRIGFRQNTSTYGELR